MSQHAGPTAETGRGPMQGECCTGTNHDAANNVLEGNADTSTRPEESVWAEQGPAADL